MFFCEAGFCLNAGGTGERITSRLCVCMRRLYLVLELYHTKPRRSKCSEGEYRERGNHYKKTYMDAIYHRRQDVDLARARHECKASQMPVAVLTAVLMVCLRCSYSMTHQSSVDDSRGVLTKWPTARQTPAVANVPAQANNQRRCLRSCIGTFVRCWHSKVYDSALVNDVTGRTRS